MDDLRDSGAEFDAYPGNISFIAGDKSGMTHRGVLISVKGNSMHCARDETPDARTEYGAWTKLLGNLTFTPRPKNMPSPGKSS